MLDALEAALRGLGRASIGTRYAVVGGWRGATGGTLPHLAA
jgi:hypothetical protein